MQDDLAINDFELSSEDIQYIINMGLEKLISFGSFFGNLKLGYSKLRDISWRLKVKKVMKEPIEPPRPLEPPEPQPIDNPEEPL